LSNSKNVGFVSCSKNESNSKSDNDGSNYDIVGTWIGYDLFSAYRQKHSNERRR
jgi:hypothetical protein